MSRYNNKWGMDLLLRGSEIIKSQDKKCIFIIYSTFFESVGISPLETCGRLRGERVSMVSGKGLRVFHRWRKEGKWRDDDGRCHQWLMDCLCAKGPAEGGEGPCRYLLFFFFKQLVLTLLWKQWTVPFSKTKQKLWYS